MTTPISTPPPSSEEISSPPPTEELAPLDSLDEMSNSPFARMFHGGATHREVQKFLEQFLETIARDIRRSTARWKKIQDRIKKAAEGKYSDD